MAVIVSCAFCEFTQKHFTDNILTQHKQYSPGCSQLRGFTLTRSERNKPDVFSENLYIHEKMPGYNRELGIDEQQAKDPDMAVSTRRDDTFLTYPYSAHDVKLLSQAGYYYEGMSDTRFHRRNLHWANILK